MAKQRGLEIDRRVGIAMSVLPTSQKDAVRRIISSPRAFAHAAARPGRVRHLHTSGQPLYMMRVSPSLRLVYTRVGDTVYVVDLVEQATLDRFALRKTARVATRSNGDGEKAAIVRKATDAVEK